MNAKKNIFIIREKDWNPLFNPKDINAKFISNLSPNTIIYKVNKPFLQWDLILRKDIKEIKHSVNRYTYLDDIIRKNSITLKKFSSKDYYLPFILHLPGWSNERRKYIFNNFKKYLSKII